MSHIGKPPCDAGVIHGTPRSPRPPLGPAAQRWTLVAAILGSSMAFVDSTVVNVALPAIQRELGASAADAQWVVESYALFLAALLLAGGAMGDRFGRRRVFMVGVALFTAASIACGLGGGVLPLIAARGVQGVGAALLVPGSLALISAAYPEERRGAAIGTWSAFSGITAAVGPLIGGYLVDHHSWAWAFYLNVPIGALLLVICWRKVPESAPWPTTTSSAPRGGVSEVAEPHSLKNRDAASADPVDAVGALLATLGLAGLVFALIEAPARGAASLQVLAAGAVGLAALAGFVRVEARSGNPMLPLRMFRDRNFTGANLLTLLLYAALGGGLYFLPLNLIQVQGYGATMAGAALLPFVVVMFSLSRWAGTLVDRFGSKLPLVVGPTIAAVGFALFAVPSIGAGYWTAFFPAVCTLGLGMSITVAPLTTTVMNAVRPELGGTASGINNAMSRVAGLVAIAVFGIVLAAVFNRQLAVELAQTGAPAEVLSAVVDQRQKLAGIDVPGHLPEALALKLKGAVGNAFVAGFRWVMLACSALALLSAASAWLLISGKPEARPAAS